MKKLLLFTFICSINALMITRASERIRLVSTCSEERITPDLQNFFERYSVTPENKLLVDLDVEENGQEFFNDGKIEIACGLLFLKDQNLTRIINAERMRSCIERYNLSLIIPQKYVYRNEDQVVVLADPVETYDFEELLLTLNELKELVMLTELTGYNDWGVNNLLRNKDGQLVCIDTEDSSFVSEEELSEFRFGAELDRFYSYMSVEARQWLESYVKQDFSIKRVNFKSLKYNTEFDGSIDFEQVKRDAVLNGLCIEKIEE